MTELYLFDIPIYWIEEATFWAQYDTRLSHHLAAFEKRSGYPLTDSLRSNLTDSFWKQYIAPWRYNQITGWVRLYKLGTQLRGELWYMNAKRAGRTIVKKQFSDHGKAFELSTFADQTSNDIYVALLRELDMLAKSGRAKYRLDLQEFRALAPFVDWHRLIYGAHCA